MMTPDYLKAAEFTFIKEAGESDRKSDAGGRTKYGISSRSYPHINLDTLTMDQAKEIGFNDFWQPAKCEEMPLALAVCVFDFAINSSVKTAIKYLQLAIQKTSDMKIEVDGIPGPVTLKSIDECPDLRYLIQRYLFLRAQYFVLITRFRAANKDNIVGWLKNRVFDLDDYAWKLFNGI